jgi:hypothetical protein
MLSLPSRIILSITLGCGAWVLASTLPHAALLLAYGAGWFAASFDISIEEENHD